MGRLTAEAERSLFRVVQESLANVQQHAAATTAWVSLRREPYQIVLEVRDNGHGFPETTSEAGAESGFGIRMLAERMRQLSGRLDVQSAPSGTTVIASLPVSSLR